LGYTRGNPDHLRPADTDSDDTEPDSHDEADLKSVQPNWSEESKLVLVVRGDLGMTKGKIAAQCRRAIPNHTSAKHPRTPSDSLTHL